MTTENSGRDPRLMTMTTPEVLAELRQHHAAEQTHREAANNHRHQVLVLSDELIRHRDRSSEVPEDQRGCKISPLARDELGVTYQAFREALGAYWAKVAPGYSPDDRPVLTDADKVKIRDRFRRGEAKYKIARDVGVAPATIRAIVDTPPKVVPYSDRKKTAKTITDAADLPE